MELIVKAFDALSPLELYEILRLRVNVFVVEQNCPYPEVDGRDPAALHLFLRDEDGVHAYLRLLPPGAFFDTASLGRVVTRDRGRGLGRKAAPGGRPVAGLAGPHRLEGGGRRGTRAAGEFSPGGSGR